MKSLKLSQQQREPLAQIDQNAGLHDECSPQLYEEFLNCNSYMYQMQEKDDSEAISSEGEFAEFQQFTFFDQTDVRFVEEEYNSLLMKKYSHDKAMLNQYLMQRYLDHELMERANEIVNLKAANSKYLTQRLVTNENELMAPRWASNSEHVLKIARL